MFKKLLTETETVKEQNFTINKDLSTEKQKKENKVFTGYIDLITVVGKTALVVDWKTGKVPWETVDEQIRLYAYWAFLNYPNIDRVKGSYVYVVFNEKKNFIYTRTDHFDKLKDFFDSRIDKIENDTEFKKTPNRFCDWCDYVKQCKPNEL